MRINKTECMNSFDNRGFSFIEVLVAIGISSILSIVILTLITESHKNNRDIKSKFELIELEQDIMRLVLNRNTCKCMFQGVALPDDNSTVPFNELKNGCQIGTNLIAVDQPVAQRSNVKTQSIALKNLVDISSGNKSGNLEIQFASDGAKFKSILIPSQSFIVKNGAILDCLGAGPMTDPVQQCASAEKIYVGSNTFNGEEPDENGCVALNSFQGQQGIAGAQGPEGPSPFLTVSGVFNAVCPPGYIKYTCWGAGSGRNWGWTQNTFGCNAWEGSRNGGAPGCACKCYLPVTDEEETQ